MTLAVIIAISAVLTLVLVLWLTISGRLQLSLGAKQDAGVPSRIQPIDVVAFRNLVDPAEDEYLWTHLSPARFRAAQRARLRARAAYVSVAGRNAALLVAMGQAALAANDEHTREAALRLVNDALLLRRNAAFAMLRIYAAMAWPSRQMPAASVLERYERLSSSAMLLGRLRNPAMPLRVAAGPR